LIEIFWDIVLIEDKEHPSSKSGQNKKRPLGTLHFVFSIVF